MVTYHLLQDDVEEDEKFLPLTISNQEGEESNYEESNCISCLLSKPVYAVTACGHMNLCGACRDSHKESGIFDQKGLELEVCCPQCRTPVTCQ